MLLVLKNIGKSQNWNWQPTDLHSEDLTWYDGPNGLVTICFYAVADRRHYRIGANHSYERSI